MLYLVNGFRAESLNSAGWTAGVGSDPTSNRERINNNRKVLVQTCTHRRLSGRWAVLGCFFYLGLLFCSLSVGCSFSPLFSALVLFYFGSSWFLCLFSVASCHCYFFLLLCVISLPQPAVSFTPTAAPCFLINTCPLFQSLNSHYLTIFRHSLLNSPIFSHYHVYSSPCLFLLLLCVFYFFFVLV